MVSENVFVNSELLVAVVTACILHHCDGTVDSYRIKFLARGDRKLIHRHINANYVFSLVGLITHSDKLFNQNVIDPWTISINLTNFCIKALDIQF